MINRVFKLLAERELIASHSPDDYSFNVSFLRGTLIQIFIDFNRSIVVKVAKINGMEATDKTLEHEFNMLKEMTDRYGPLVPEPLLLERQDSHTFLALKGIEHTPVTLPVMLQRNQAEGARFIRFLSGTDRVANDIAHDHWEKFNRACSKLPTQLANRIARIAERQRWKELLDSLPNIPQHSDLTINNVALASHDLLVFDWEDYGQSTLPGMDLCTILASGTDFDAGKVIRLIQEAIPTGGNSMSLLSDCINKLPIDSERMIEILIINLAVFFELKKRLQYADFVLDYIAGFLTDVLSNNSMYEDVSN